MEIHEQNEAFVEQNEDVIFSHTKVILKEGDQYYYAITSHRYHSTSEVDPSELNIVPIPSSQLWPEFPTTFTRAPEPLPSSCYVKRPSLLHYDETTTSNEMADLLRNEAEICEILSQHPHPNILRYLGCVVTNGMITGLCLVKYDMALLERLSNDPRPFNGDFCLEGIQKGIYHLHSLGLIHNDINPANIMMDEDDVPIIIDFDSARRDGFELGFKAGTFGWTDENFKVSRSENDEYGLEKIREMLSERKTLNKD
jgi:serine/threonine protein kinase